MILMLTNMLKYMIIIIIISNDYYDITFKFNTF